MAWHPYSTEQLRAFEMVVDEGTFEGAAARLSITQPAVSQRIKLLETAAGRVLLRRGRPTLPTEAGEVILRLARQVSLSIEEADRALGSDASIGQPRIRIAVNADSLATWALPPLAQVTELAHIHLEVMREDQGRSTDLLRDGRAMAAITSNADPVQGCSVDRLGVMRYSAVAAPAFARRWFPDGLSAEALAKAPVIDFDRNDHLQQEFIDFHAPGAEPPRHFVPGSSEYVHAIVLGMGWGLVPDLQSHSQIEAGGLRHIDQHATLDLPMYWQQWRLPSQPLEAVAEAVAAAAHHALASGRRPSRQAAHHGH